MHDASIVVKSHDFYAIEVDDIANLCADPPGHNLKSVDHNPTNI